jgi:hypothetical protein
MAGAANDVVTNCNSSGSGSLPAVVAAASSGDAITFSVTCPPSSPITLSSTINIDTNLTINGPGASELAVSGDNAVEVFDVPTSSVNATISGITIQDGNAAVKPYVGGGIFNAGTLTVTDSVLSDNTAPDKGGAIQNNLGIMTVSDTTVSGNSSLIGGGIENDATGTNDTTMTISDSTVSGNTAIDNGGGIAQHGKATIENSTIANNSSGGPGGGVWVYTSQTADLLNDTISGNSGGDIYAQEGIAYVGATMIANSSGYGDCVGTITDLGYNLDDDGTCGFTASTDLSDTPANLDRTGLQYNGGPTQTIALESDSHAIAAVNNASFCSSSDQRQSPRPTPCDIGAVQLVLYPAISSPNSATATLGSPFSFTVTTTGNPVPTISEKGALPKKLTFTDNGNGTATISGKPKTAGTYHLTIKATFGSGTSKDTVTQSFTLTVDSG